MSDKCHNYNLCKAHITREENEKYNSLCVYCHYMFNGKKLKFYNEKTCNFCFARRCAISQPFCNHILCSDCFTQYFFNNGEANLVDSSKSYDYGLYSELDHVNLQLNFCPVCTREN